MRQSNGPLAIPALLAAVSLAALLTGCVSSPEPLIVESEVPSWPEAPEISAALVDSRISVPDMSEVMALSAEQRHRFQAYLEQPDLQAMPLHERTSEYLQTLLKRFEYHPDTTSAMETRQHLRGNCMSLAVLTTALADLAGVKVKYRLIEQVPVFDIRGGLMVTSMHVRTILIQSHHRFESGQFIYGQSRLAIDFFPEASHRSGRRISRDDFLSMYYRNLAVEALVRDQPNKAMTFAAATLALAPRQEQAINLVGLIHSRLGDDEGAERFYRYGLSVASQTLSIMNNYLGLLNRQGREKEAQAMAQQIRELDEPSPFGWLRLAMAAQRKEAFSDAIHYFEKALHYAPELGLAWQGLALSLARSGVVDSDRLIFAQTQAMRFADDPGRGNALAKKIYSLKSPADPSLP